MNLGLASRRSHEYTSSLYDKPYGNRSCLHKQKRKPSPVFGLCKMIFPVWLSGPVCILPNSNMLADYERNLKFISRYLLHENHFRKMVSWSYKKKNLIFRLPGEANSFGIWPTGPETLLNKNLQPHESPVCCSIVYLLYDFQCSWLKIISLIHTHTHTHTHTHSRVCAHTHLSSHR